MDIMNEINVVFSFDENYVLPALVAGLSLLDSGLRGREGESYAFYFLTEKRLSASVVEKFEKYLTEYSNCASVKFVVSKDFREDVFESRHLTRATYLRLEIPDLIGEDKVIYSDIDVLFLAGLKSLWDICVDDVYLAATLDVGINQRSKFSKREKQFAYWKKYYGGRQGTYFQAGILLMNLKALREKGMVEKWRSLSKEKFNYHDMDILNITCYPGIKKLDSEYNVIPGYFVEKGYEKGVEEGFLDEHEIKRVYECPVMIHYAGESKPWKCPSVPGSYEYWSFLGRFPDLEREVRENFVWTLRDRIGRFFVKPLF